MLYEAGKGSRPRAKIDQEAYASNYDLIFGKKRKVKVEDAEVVEVAEKQKTSSLDEVSEEVKTPVRTLNS
jgi:hypothetical protein